MPGNKTGIELFSSRDGFSLTGPMDPGRSDNGVPEKNSLYKKIGGVCSAGKGILHDECRCHQHRELVLLKTGTTKPYAFLEEQLREVEDMIPGEYATMNASYEYGDFPVRPSQRECLSCKFAEVCPEAGIARA